jgi:general secretion pathway protein E/type IV pilus assembly protein PilB
MTGLRLKPVLAPTEAIQREMKKRLGVGADTIDTLGEKPRFRSLTTRTKRTPISTARRKTPRSSGS